VKHEAVVTVVVLTALATRVVDEEAEILKAGEEQQQQLSRFLYLKPSAARSYQ
jgi:hypothetical protein